MKKDPNKACVQYEENLFWAIVHDLLAHPLMALTLYSKPAEWLHDQTSTLAWKRKPRVSCAHCEDWIEGHDLGTMYPSVFGPIHHECGRAMSPADKWGGSFTEEQKKLCDNAFND